MAKRKPPCATCQGAQALATERCPACTSERSGILPRETRKLYLTLYARFGRWEPGLFCFVNAVSPELRADGEKARVFYLDKVKPVEDRAEATPWGLVAPADVLPAPTFPPFVPASRPSQGGPGVFRERGSVRVNLSRTCGGCGQKPIGKLGVCPICGAVKELVAEETMVVEARTEELPPDLGDPAADFKRLLRGYRKSPPRVEPVEEPTLEEQELDLEEDIPF